MKCRLPADPKAWLSTGEYRGEMSELIWDEDGEAMKLPTRPTNYVPPNTQSPDHRYTLPFVCASNPTQVCHEMIGTCSPFAPR